MAEMEVTVGLRREPGHDALHLARLQIVLNYLFKEIQFLGLFHFIQTLINPTKIQKSGLMSDYLGIFVSLLFIAVLIWLLPEATSL